MDMKHVVAPESTKVLALKFLDDNECGEQVSVTKRKLTGVIGPFDVVYDDSGTSAKASALSECSDQQRLSWTVWRFPKLKLRQRRQ